MYLGKKKVVGMKSVEFDSFGGPEVLHVRERPEPGPIDGRCRIRVSARTVNVSDIEIRRGDYPELIENAVFPAILGWDFAGTLIDPTDTLPAGTPVGGYVQWIGSEAGRGTYAEVIAAKPEYVSEIPADVDPNRAAVLGMNALTGAQATDLLGKLPGANVFITGASGPVGLAAALIAMDCGANVYVSGSADDPYLEGLGFAGVIQRATAAEMAAQLRELVPDGADALFNAGVASQEIMDGVRDGGRFVRAHELESTYSMRNVEVSTVLVRPDSRRLSELFRTRLVDHTRIADVQRLEEAAAVHRRVEAGGMKGQKIVLAS
ncbi:hypothetical protein OJ963_41410 [Streptomyces sp. RS2]|uniref:alcohol dehydrogenase catalytic domain-containing protein n=1 Tax=Streptomyces sp. RS2 TaxID=1451205 RepID=UPI0021F814F8|nr:hypothetical protein [Streptomyces sp. RS2]MCW1100223.1 hypothetical protein [Streptomyces sp. RS2]